MIKLGANSVLFAGFDLETDAGTLRAGTGMEGLLRFPDPQEATYTGAGTKGKVVLESGIEVAPVYGPADSVRVSTPNGLAGLGTAGTIRINGVALTPSTPLGSLNGSLVAIQGGGRVKIGPWT